MNPAKITAQIARFIARDVRERFVPSDFRVHVHGLRKADAETILAVLQPFVDADWLLPDRTGWAVTPGLRDRLKRQFGPNRTALEVWAFVQTRGLRL